MSVCILKMLYFNKIGVSEGIDVNKKSESKEGDVCHWYFVNKGFKFQPNDCKKCQDLLMMCMNLSDTTILNIKGSDYCSIIVELAKMRP